MTVEIDGDIKTDEQKENTERDKAENERQSQRIKSRIKDFLLCLRLYIYVCAIPRYKLCSQYRHSYRQGFDRFAVQSFAFYSLLMFVISLEFL